MIVGNPDTHIPVAAAFTTSLRVHFAMVASFPKIRLLASSIANAHEKAYCKFRFKKCEISANVRTRVGLPGRCGAKKVNIFGSAVASGIPRVIGWSQGVRGECVSCAERLGGRAPSPAWRKSAQGWHAAKRGTTACGQSRHPRCCGRGRPHSQSCDTLSSETRPSRIPPVTNRLHSARHRFSCAGRGSWAETLMLKPRERG